MRSNHTHTRAHTRTHRCLLRIKSSKLSRFNCKAAQNKREKKRACVGFICFLPGNIIKRAFNLIEYNPKAQIVNKYAH